MRGVHAGKQSEEDGLWRSRQCTWQKKVSSAFRLRGLHHEQTEQWNYLGGGTRCPPMGETVHPVDGAVDDKLLN